MPDPRLLAAAAVVVLASLSACSSDPGTPDDPTTGPDAASPTAPASPSEPDPTTTSPSTSTPPEASTTDADGPSPAPTPLDAVRARWRVAAEGFDAPLQVLALPDGRVVVLEQPGRISTLDGGDVVLDLADRVVAGGERGLLGAAVHPDGDRLFVHYSGADGRTVVSVFPLGSEGGTDPGAEQVLLEQAQPAANHNGGSLLFDPDGALVLALGDGGAAGDRFGNGQDPSTVLGALLRFDADGDTLAPADGNPFLDGGGAPEVWAFGLRNPWRIAFDDEHLYVADVGQDAVEEVDVVARDEVAGANFGWPILEGSTCYRADECDASGTVQPVAELRHEDGACSLIGGVVVPPGHASGLGGAYLYSDLCDTRLHALRVGEDGDVDTAVVRGGELSASPLGFGTGPDGQVWVGTTDGQVLELDAG